MPELTECPKKLLTPEVYLVTAWFFDFKQLNLLPYPGSIGDQPWFVVQAIGLCKTYENEIQNERDKKDQKTLSALGKKDKEP